LKKVCSSHGLSFSEKWSIVATKISNRFYR